MSFRKRRGICDGGDTGERMRRGIANERERVSGTIKPSPLAHHLMPASRQIGLLLAHPTPGGGGSYEAGG